MLAGSESLAGAVWCTCLSCKQKAMPLEFGLGWLQDFRELQDGMFFIRYSRYRTEWIAARGASIMTVCPLQKKQVNNVLGEQRWQDGKNLSLGSARIQDNRIEVP